VTGAADAEYVRYTDGLATSALDYLSTSAAARSAVPIGYRFHFSRVWLFFFCVDENISSFI